MFLAQLTEAWFFGGVYSSVDLTFDLPIVGKKTISMTPVDIRAVVQGGATSASVLVKAEVFGYALIDPQIDESITLGERITLNQLGVSVETGITLKIVNWSISFPINTGLEVAANIIAPGPPSASPMIVALSNPAASMAIRVSSPKLSKVNKPAFGTGSETPLPRAS